MLKNITSNFQSPKKNFFGRMLLRSMNFGHRNISKWATSLLPKDADFKEIIDIGCGGGWTLSRLLKTWSTARVYGLDVSEASVEKSRDYNAQAVADGRCEVTLGDVAAMPYQADFFDVATAIETVYFWDPLDNGLKEVYRCLKPDGWFIIALEAGTKGQAEFWSRHVEGMHAYDTEFLKERLLAVGFRSVNVERRLVYACIVARK